MGAVEVIAASTSALLGAVGLLEVARRGIVKPLHRISETLEDVTGRPARVINGFEIEPRIPGLREVVTTLDRRVALVDRADARVLNQLAELNCRIGDVEAHFVNNGGSTFKDSLDGVKNQVGVLVDHVVNGGN